MIHKMKFMMPSVPAPILPRRFAGQTSENDKGRASLFESRTGAVVRRTAAAGLPMEKGRCPR
jgi:hypothetical protein